MRDIIDALEARVAELEAQNEQLQRELNYAKSRAKELEAETLRLEDLSKNRGKLMSDAIDQSRDLEARIKTITEGYARENTDIEQTCGKVLGYPRYCDDQKNFPGATEEDGVCISDHVAASIVAELANKYRVLLARCDQLEEAGNRLESRLQNGPMEEYKEGEDAEKNLLLSKWRAAKARQ